MTPASSRSECRSFPSKRSSLSSRALPSLSWSDENRRVHFHVVLRSGQGDGEALGTRGGLDQKGHLDPINVSVIQQLGRLFELPDLWRLGDRHRLDREKRLRVD